MKYPKIETLYKRDEETHRVMDKIRCPEFENIKNWLVTEKIDGTNIRVLYTNHGSQEYAIEFRGRTDKAEIPPFLLEKLEKMFSHVKMLEVFKEATQVYLHGEGYGARIQKGGGNYREGVSFRLCDVWIDGWWLEWDSVVEIAEKLEIKTVPCFGQMNFNSAIDFVKANSVVAEEEKGLIDIPAEGIVVRSYPLMLFRNGTPIKWKLKKRDYREKKL